MKRAILFLLVITAGSIPVSAKYSGGTGDPNTPYQIANVADLMTLANDTNDYNKCFIMTADVNLQGQVFNTAIIAPNIGGDPCFIGAPFTGTFFTGTFDGNGHKITNFTISGGYSFIGLFGYISSNGSVKNLGLEGCSFSGFEQVGALCGRNQGGSIANCYSTGTVNGHDRTGGLCGVNEEGSINSSITDCYSTGNVTGSYDTGGLCGYGGNITNCFSTGDVSGNKWTGGLCGAGGDIANCYSTGDVSGNNCTGGLCGVGSNITNCYSTGSVSGNDEYTGGLVGQMYGTISNSCFLDTAGPNNGAGIPLTDTQMKQQSSFVGWDFVGETTNGTNDYWEMLPYAYPHLAWENVLRKPDLNGDAFVNFIDYAIFADDWQQSPDPFDPNSGDIFRDGLVDIYDFAVFAEQWLACFVTEAANPDPPDNATDVSRDVILQWSPGENAVSHDVYFGTDFNDVNNADITNLDVYMGNLDVNFWDTNNYAPDGLIPNTNYYWRVDEVAGCTAKGNTFNFKVTPESKLTASDGAAYDYFGQSVSISGDRCIVGAWGEDHGWGEEGSAYIYAWNGTNWIQQAKLTASDGFNGDFFGYAVSISGNRCIVGAEDDDDKGTNSGSAYIYEWDGTNWIQQAKLTASDGAALDFFGQAVSISGDRCIIGAYGDDSYRGSAYVFECNGTNWIQQAKLTASDRYVSDYFGYTVSISGDRCISGARWDDDKGKNSGSAYIYEWNGTNWIQQTKLVPSDGSAYDYFGESVSISGNRCLIGSWGDDDKGAQSGSAYIYEWDGTNWTQQAKLTASDGILGDSFGQAVNINDGRCIVGAYNSAYIFEWNGTNWTQKTKVRASDLDVFNVNFFGNAVSISGNRCIAGSHDDDDKGTDSGSAYIYELGP